MTHEGPAAGVSAGREPAGSSVLREPGRQPGPAADGPKAQEHQGCEPEHDQEELQHLVVDRTREAAQEDVHEDHARRDQDARVEAPAEQQVEKLPHGVERDARREYGHHGERHGVDRTGLLVEAEAQVLGDRTGPGPVVERHHEQAEEDHGRDGADPVEVARSDAVLRARRSHPDHLLSAQVGRYECQPGHPRGDRPAGEKEILAGVHIAS